MQLHDLDPIDVRPLLREERAELLALLGTLTTAEWKAPTAADSWDVKSVVLHLLDDDLGWLSRNRDSDRSGLLEVAEYGSFVQALAAKNQRWIDGTPGLSPRVIIGLLEWSGDEMDRWWSTIDLTATGDVIWAGGDVPEWFDIAQDLTERWVHQMQIREALDRVEAYAARYLPTILQTFVWAAPHQYRASAPASTLVNIDLGLPAGWHLRCVDDHGRWELEPGLVDQPAASLSTDQDTAWRLLTGAAYDPERVTCRGVLAKSLLDVRGIIV